MSAVAAAACLAAGRYARHRPQGDGTEGGRHEANWNDRGARCAAEHVHRRGSGLHAHPALSAKGVVPDAGNRGHPPLIRRARLVLIILAALIGSSAPALTATAASAATSPVYTFTVADVGQGFPEGGALMSDGTVSGGGELSILNGKVIASITGAGWRQVDPTDVKICFNLEFLRPPIPAHIECNTVPVGGPTKVQLAGIAETLIRVTPVGAGG